METLQILLLAIASVWAVRLLFLKFFKKNDSDCGPNCGRA